MQCWSTRENPCNVGLGFWANRQQAMANLPRLKPDPIPQPHPVPEFLAESEPKARYEDMKAVLGVPWMGVVTMSFAHYRAFYDASGRVPVPSAPRATSPMHAIA